MNFDGKTFGLLSNSEEGEVSTETLFHYKQEGDLVTADYSGGTIRHGKIIAKQNKRCDLEMVYNCLTNDGELRSGKAYAKVSINSGEKIQLDLDWKWLEGEREKGTSIYTEIEG